MMQFLLFALQLVAIVVLGMLSIVFIVLAVVKRKDKKQLAILLTSATICIIGTTAVSFVDLFAAESKDREITQDAFESNFGFKPPNSVKEVMLKNFGIYDTDVHWMAFTYDSAVFLKVLTHDQPLDTAARNTAKFSKIAEDLENGCANCPDWLELPKNNTIEIYYKKDFLDHTYSDYYLWVDTERRMVYLQVSYFD